MSESLIISPHSGQAVTTKEPTKHRIHELELPFLEDDVEKMKQGCLAVTIQNTAQGPQPAIGPGFDTSAAIVFVETSRALAKVRRRLDVLESENEELRNELAKKEDA